MARWTTMAACAALAVLALSRQPASAADEAAQLEAGNALVAEMVASHKAKDAAALGAQAKKAVEIHNGIEDKGLRGKLQKELGSAYRDKDVEGAHDAILEALSQLNDPNGAYKQIKKYMPTPKTEAASDREKAVLAAVDKLAPESAMKELLDLAEKAKDYSAGALAIAALGSFKASKKRVSILESMIKLLARFEPPRGQTVGEETKKRWDALAAPLIQACNEITGQKIREPGEWHELWKANKKKPDKIFVGD